MTNSDILIWIDNAILNPSRENFCMTFAMVIQHLSLTDNELAKVIQVPRPTIKRWVRGESCVHPIGREPILKFLREKVVSHEEP